MAIRYLSGINVDSNTLFVDDVNNRVGIRTASPAYTLHVNLNATGYIARIQGSTNNISFYDGGSGGIGIGTDVNQDLKLYTNDTLNNGIVIKPSGNVGIGTTAPAVKLQVDTTGVAAFFKSTGNQVPVSIFNTAQTIASIGFKGSTTTDEYRVRVGADGNDFIAYTANVERLRILNGGNVGIGTTSPSNLLHVAKSQTADTAIMVSNLGTSGATTTMSFVLAESTTPQGWFRRYRDGSGNTEIGFSDALLFSGSVTGTKAERMRINAVGDVGIGTNAPTATGNYRTLEVKSANASAGGMFILATSDNAGVMRMYSTSTVLYIDDSSSTSDLYFKTNGANYVALGTNNAERLRVTSAGNVGIGTTAPSSKLEVYDSANSNTFTITSDGANEQFRIRRYSNTNEQLIIGFHSSDYGYIQTVEQGVAYRPLSLNPNGGNVGIGTTAPDAKLVIVTGSTDDSGNSFSFTGYGSKEYVSISKLGFIRSRASDLNGANMHFLDNGGTNRMEMSVGTTLMNWYSHALGSTFMVFQHTTGNVGIGTTSPATKLHVVGYSRNDGGLLLNGSDADYREMIFTTSSAARWNLYAYGGEGGSNAGSVLYLARYADNGDYIANVATFLRTNGYVGIATTTPTQQLHVSGNIRVTGAYYDSNNSAGTSGQVLSSTGSGTAWVNQGEAVASSLFDLLPNARVTYDWTVQLTAGTWADIFSSTTVLSNGTWMVQAYVNDFAVGGQQYQETYSGVMSWGNANSTNQGGNQAISEIVLHRSGHAANSGNFYLRTVERASSTLLFQGMSNLSHTAATTINFKFVKIF